jgi:hypothetical protein
MNNNVSEIIPGLWIGDKRAASDRTFLSDKKISVVLNCSTDIPFVDYNRMKLNIKKIRIKIKSPKSERNDREISKYNTLFYKYLQNTLSFLYENLTIRNNNVLIYCNTGNIISVAFAAAYLIQYGKITKASSLKCIRSKRNDAPLNNYFSMALSIFEKNNLRS